MKYTGLLSFHFRLLQQLLRLIPIFGIPDVDPPTLKPNRVDRPPALNQQVNRLADLVLPAVRRLHQVTRVEDRGRERVEAGHHQIARRIVGLLDDVRDLAVLVRVTHAVPTRVLPVDLLDEERRVGPLLALASHHVRQVRVEDVVAEDEHEVVVDVLLDGQQRVCQPLLFALVRVGDGNALVLVAVVVDDHLLQVAHDHHELVRAQLDQLVETVREDGLVVDFDHPLRFVFGEGPQAGPLAGR